MPKTLRVTPHLTPDELVASFLKCDSKDEKLRWQAVMLKAEGRGAKDIADICKRREDWVRRTVRRYNQMGPDGVTDQRQSNGRAPYLNDEQQTDLWEAIQGPAPDGGLWTAPKVAKWIDAHAGHKVDDHTGWLYLRRLGYTRHSPRPTHPESDEKAQEAFKKGGFKKLLIRSFENIPTPTSRSGQRTKLALG
ncbi:MAG: winged helix-turn-helix domain-containing protein [Pseudomonadota bacterium]|nr:winged helix-turn-helix domain-containing protein [Pseudomonadota bacterium]